jgi:hypothetical protein
VQQRPPHTRRCAPRKPAAAGLPTLREAREAEGGRGPRAPKTVAGRNGRLCWLQYVLPLYREGDGAAYVLWDDSSWGAVVFRGRARARCSSDAIIGDDAFVDFFVAPVVAAVASGGEHTWKRTRLHVRVVFDMRLGRKHGGGRRRLLDTGDFHAFF